MNNLLKIYTYVDGINDAPFPSAEAHIEISSFNYNAKRMGGAPTISTSVMYKDCLDNLWTGKEYVVYNGERYKLKQTPTSSKSNTDARYKHNLELVALRVVLDYVYFFDAVIDNTPVDDKPVTNSTKVVFSGDIHEFAKRLNASLKYTKLDYSVVVDEGITSETKFLEFTDQPISSVLQEIYKQYEIPYYFVGNVIHIGFTSNAITTPFKYGVNDALLSISKNNANNKIINRCTGVGSSENIPYFYPNEHPLGKVNALYNKKNDDALKITNHESFGSNVKLATQLTYTKTEKSEFAPTNQWYSSYLFASGKKDRDDFFSKFHWWAAPMLIREAPHGQYWDDAAVMEALAAYGDYMAYTPLSEYQLLNEKNPHFAVRVYWDKNLYKADSIIKLPYEITTIIGDFKDAKEFLASWTVEYYVRFPYVDYGLPYYLTEKVNGKTGFTFPEPLKGVNPEPYIYVIFTLDNPPSKNESIAVKANVKINISPSIVSYDWHDENGGIKQLSFYGLRYNGTPNVGDTITFEQVAGSLIPYQDALMPPVYWQTKGAESFYNALNNTYVSPETGEYYSFENQYRDENRREHKETFDYIKPSIEFVRNGDGKPINMFLEFAYDENDNDEIDEQGNYLHPYFFAKLRKTNGDNPFNLFESANEKGEMTISMTSGNCGSCQFVVGVEENTKKNIVQVDDNGVLIYENGKVKFGAAQDRQNDTINNEVWIALKKDIQTFDTLLPNASIRPKACTNADANDGDTFVITNISLPTSYIREAEERLKEEIIKYMKLNNSEKFTFSIKFSRIYLAENPFILAQLNENARIQIEYNEVLYELYVSSYQYKVVNNEVLPEITVELADTLSTNENALQQALNAVEHSIMSSVGSIDFYKQGLRYFIRKDVEDWARGLLHLTKGATFGTNDIAKIDEQGNAEFVSQIIRQFISTPLFIDGFAGQGFKLWLDENGKSNLTVDNLTARETFRVFEMLVTKLRAVNGGLFVSAANGTIKSVSESEDRLYYDILLENENTFIAGDYMRCQVMSGVDITSYWVEISEVNGGICRVPKTEFGFSLPAAGQDVVLCGSKNEGRQNAIHISATDDGQPRIDILNGISTKSFEGCLRTRLGNLDGIRDEYFGENQPHGDGLYSDNAYLKGDFILKNSGENVETKFAITEEGIKSTVEQTQAEAIKGKTLLYNASFTKGLDGWLASNTDSTYFSGTSLLFASGSMLSQSVSVSSEPIYDNVFFVNIKNGWIKQSNLAFINKPEFDGMKEYPLFFSANIRCNESGVLNVYLTNIEASQANTFIGYSDNEYLDSDYIFVNLTNNNTSYALLLSEFGSISTGDKIAVKIGKAPKLFNLTQGYEIPLTDWREEQISDGAVTLSEPCNLIYIGEVNKTAAFAALDIGSLNWNGKGDFYLSFTGDADFYGLTIFTDKTEVRHKTFFEQGARLIAFGSQVLNDDGTIKKESGIVVQAEGAGLYAKDENGNQSRIAAYADGKVVLEGGEIQLKGNLTTDGKFKVKDDGSIETRNALINGFVQQGTMYINDDNYTSFYKDTTLTTWQADITDASPIIILEHTYWPAGNIALSLPSVDLYATSSGSVTRAHLEYIRGFVDCSILIYNYTAKNIVIWFTKSNGETNTENLPSGVFVRMRCNLGYKEGYHEKYGEFIYWEVLTQGKVITMAD